MEVLGQQSFFFWRQQTWFKILLTALMAASRSNDAKSAPT
jgi:hypothetical protein